MLGSSLESFEGRWDVRGVANAESAEAVEDGCCFVIDQSASCEELGSNRDGLVWWKSDHVVMDCERKWFQMCERGDVYDVPKFSWEGEDMASLVVEVLRGL